MTTLIYTLLSLVVSQAHLFKIHIVDKNNIPVEGAYIQIDKTFLFSDNNGDINISDGFSSSDSIFISHLSFKKKSTTIGDLGKISNIAILESDIRELNEIVVSNIDVKKYVTEAIKLIPQNYGYAFNPPLAVHADILFLNSDDNSEIIKYKGELVLRQEKKDIYANKNNYVENVEDDSKKYIFQLKPYNFVSIIPISSHPVIKKYHDFDFYKYEYVLYKNQQALKVYFTINKKHGGQSGFLIINSEDKGIMSLNYRINPINDWIGEKTKKGIVKTSLLQYFVEADYERTGEEAYTFSSGRENIKISTKVGKETINTTSDSYLKKINGGLEGENKVKLKDIFN